MLARLGAGLAQGRFSINALTDSVRTVMAGLFLIFPGVVSDLIAFTLLLLPARTVVTESARARRPAGRILEGEFRRSR